MKNNNGMFTDKPAVDFTKLVELMPGHVYWRDPQGIVQGCNNQLAKSLGFNSKEAIIGKTVYELLWHKLPETEKERLLEFNIAIEKSVMDSGTAHTREELITTKEGTKNYLINKIPLKNTADETVGVISIAMESISLKVEKKPPRKKVPLTGDALIQQQLLLNDPQHPRLKILLVEDDQIASKTAISLLQSFQHEVDSASNSVEAISHFRPNKYDIIFTDVGLPDLDGYKLTEQFRKLEADIKADPTPIVALTAHDSNNISNKAAASGLNAILTKPLSQTEVIKAITQFVYDKKTQTNNPPPPPLVHPPQNPTNRFTKSTIDLDEGAKILGKDHVAATDMLQELINSLPETRRDIEKAFCTNNLERLGDVIHKFYGGLCYVGAPPLRQATKEIETALVKQDKSQLNRLYQRMLDEMSAVEREFANLKKTL